MMLAAMTLCLVACQKNTGTNRDNGHVFERQQRYRYTEQCFHDLPHINFPCRSTAIMQRLQLT